MISTIQRSRAMEHVSVAADAIASRRRQVRRLRPLVDRATYAPFEVQAQYDLAPAV
jgi:hypothetical protein